MQKFQIKDFFSPIKILHWKHTLWQSQYWPEERMITLQWKLLSQILDHCFQNVPFYMDKFKKLGIERQDIQSFEDLKHLPILQKKDVFEHNEAFKAIQINRFSPQKHTTSGTTGSPMDVYWDRDSNIMELLGQWRHYSWFGYRLGDAFMDVRSYRQLLNSQSYWNRQCRGLDTSSAFWDETNIHECAEIIRKHHIKFWRGHPNAIYHMCQYFEAAGIEDIKPRYVISVAETLLPFQKVYIEKWAGCPVAINFGLNEHTALICQCPAGNLHIASEYGLLEIIKGNGEPAKPGEQGRLISTGLHNRAFPLLRYETGDEAILADEKCQCGRTLPIVKELTGRTNDYILDSNHKKIYGMHISFHMTTGIRYSQIVQNKPGTLDVYIIPTNEYNEAIEKELKEKLNLETGNRLDIKIHLVETLPYPAKRKFKFVINNLAQE